jgi:hypothetical protein
MPAGARRSDDDVSPKLHQPARVSKPEVITFDTGNRLEGHGAPLLAREAVESRGGVALRRDRPPPRRCAREEAGTVMPSAEMSSSDATRPILRSSSSTAGVGRANRPGSESGRRSAVITSRRSSARRRRRRASTISKTRPPRSARLGAAIGARSSAGAPTEVEGRLWGVIIVASSRDEGLPAGIEHRLAAFTELVATAIANTRAREELAASRAGLVAAADDNPPADRPRLHDGAQNRLVQTS